MERNLFSEEVRRKINKKYNPKSNEYQTSAPIVNETNAPNVYLTLADMEKIKDSIESYSRDYTTQFNNLMIYIDRVILQYESLINKIDSLGAYIEDLRNNSNGSRGKINGELVEDINYYIRRDENSYYHDELMPKLTSLYENSISYVTSILESQIIEIVNELYESEEGKKIINKNFLNSINYYQHINSLVDIKKAFKIEKADLSTGEIDDNGTVQVIRSDPSKYSKIKGITKGNDIVEITIAGTNPEAGGIIIQGVGKQYTNAFDPSIKPIFAELFKSDVSALKQAWISDIVANGFESELDNFTDSIEYELTEFTNISLDENCLFGKNKYAFIANSTNGKVYVNGHQADFSVSKIKVNNDSICVISTIGDLWVLGNNTNNRLGLGKNVKFTDNWKMAKISDTVEGEIVDVWILDLYTIFKTSTNQYFIAGATEICNNDTKEYFHLIGKYKEYIWIEGVNLLFFRSLDNTKLYSCGDNYYGECGVGSDLDFIVEPTIIDISGISSSTLIKYEKNKPSIYLMNVYKKEKDKIIYNLYVFGRNRYRELLDTNEEKIKEPVFMCQALKETRIGFIIDPNNELYVRGNNTDGRLGVNSNKLAIPFTLLRSVDEDSLQGLTNNVESVTCIGNNTYIKTLNGNLYVCGNNKCGMLGLGHDNPVLKATMINDDKVINNVDSVFGLDDFAVIFTRYNLKENNEYDNEILVCGNNRDGILGLPDTELHSFEKISLSYGKYIPYYYNKNLYFKKIDGKLYGSGLNQYGQLGTGDREKVNSFVEINMENIVSISNYIKNNIYFITEEGEVYASGLNNCGQIGIDSDENYITRFTKIEGLNNIKYGFNDGTTAYFVDTNNDLYSIGDNTIGKCGIEGRNDISIRTPLESGFSIEQMEKFAIINDDISVLEKDLTENETEI